MTNYTQNGPQKVDRWRHRAELVNQGATLVFLIFFVLHWWVTARCTLLSSGGLPSNREIAGNCWCVRRILLSLHCQPNLHGKTSLNLVSPNSRRAIRVQTFFLLEGSKRHQHVEDVVVAGCNHKAGKVSIGLVYLFHRMSDVQTRTRSQLKHILHCAHASFVVDSYPQPRKSLQHVLWNHTSQRKRSTMTPNPAWPCNTVLFLSTVRCRLCDFSLSKLVWT